jgi:hypothetical protein
MLEYIPCYGGPAEHWGLLPATRLASREILIEQQKVDRAITLCTLWSSLFTLKRVLYIKLYLYVQTVQDAYFF